MCMFSIFSVLYPDVEDKKRILAALSVSILFFIANEQTLCIVSANISFFKHKTFSFVRNYHAFPQLNNIIYLFNRDGSYCIDEYKYELVDCYTTSVYGVMTKKTPAG